MLKSKLKWSILRIICFESRGQTPHPHCHSAENGDYDVAVAEIVETDYGYFLRMDSGSGQFGYRWYRDTPNQLDRVDTWETDDLSTYSGTDSYVRVE